LQQGYECTRRFLTEFISSSSSDSGIQPENHCNNGHTETSNERLSQNDIQCSFNQTVHDVSLPEHGEMSTQYRGLNSSLGTPAFVACLSASEDSVPWCTAAQQLEASCGLDSSYIETSVLETLV